MAEESPLVQDWVLEALEGDQYAFGKLVEHFQHDVYNLAYRLLGNAQEAEDAAQEGFLRAYANLKRYDTQRSFKTWLLSITSNHCIDRLRKRRLTWLSIDDDQFGPHPALTSQEAGPEQQYLDGERSQQMQALLAQLPPDYRTAVVLRYWYDMSYAEIAETLETTESAIKSRLFRARQSLGQLLQKPEPASGSPRPEPAPAMTPAMEGT